MRDQLSKNFFRDEFACECGCGFDNIDSELISVLQDARDWFNAPIGINSGCRCQAHNDSLPNSSKNSQHVKGTAADIVVHGVMPSTVQKYFETKYPNKYGIGRYRSFTHIDVRKFKARW